MNKKINLSSNKTNGGFMNESTKVQVLRMKDVKVNKMIIGDESSSRIQVLKLLMKDRDYVNCKSKDKNFESKLREASKNKIPLVIHDLENLSEENQLLILNEIKTKSLEVVSITNNIEDAVQQGSFREDLYYYLNTVVFSGLHKRLTNQEYEELENGIKTNVNQPLYEVEKAHVLNVLKFFNGNKVKAAESLGITNKTLYIKLHEYESFANAEAKLKEQSRCYGRMSAKPSACGCGDC